MNRGSRGIAGPPRPALQTFNEAPIHESGKFSEVRIPRRFVVMVLQ